MIIHLEKAGTNPDQRPFAKLVGPGESVTDLAVGDVFHVAGQPDDVKWRVARFERQEVRR